MEYQIINIQKNLRDIFVNFFKQNGEKLILKSSDLNPLVYHKKTEQMTYIYKGKGILVLNSDKINISEGDLIIIPKKACHSFKSKSNELETYHIHWPLDFLETDRYIEKNEVIL